jgi:hypothetical protein
MRRFANTILAHALIALALGAVAAPAGASPLGVVSKTGVAVCWQATNDLYSKQLWRAARLWNEIAGARRVMHRSEGCIPNFEISVNVTSQKTDVQGITYDGESGYKGHMIFFQAALDEWPECRKWIALHEMGHAMGLAHDRRYRTIMHDYCPADTGKPVGKPTRRDVAQFHKVWATWPRGIETDLELATAE